MTEREHRGLSGKCLVMFLFFLFLKNLDGGYMDMFNLQKFFVVCLVTCTFLK